LPKGIERKKQDETSVSEKFLFNAIVYLTGADNGKYLDETLASGSSHKNFF
jgi:hypothetical protein